MEGPDSTEARRAWDADVRRRCVAQVKERESKLFDRDDDGNFVLLKTAALWREIAEENPSGVQYASLRYWNVGRPAVNFYMEVLIRAPGDESVRQ